MYLLLLAFLPKRNQVTCSIIFKSFKFLFHSMLPPNMRQDLVYNFLAQKWNQDEQWRHKNTMINDHWLKTWNANLAPTLWCGNFAPSFFLSNSHYVFNVLVNTFISLSTLNKLFNLPILTQPNHISHRPTKCLK